MSIALAGLALVGFGLGLRIGLFGLVASTVAVGAVLALSPLVTDVDPMSLTRMAMMLAIFQLSAFGAMVARHGVLAPAESDASAAASTAGFGLRGLPRDGAVR